MNDRTAEGPNGKGRFTTTHWSMVLAAAQTHSPEAEAALEKLCLSYWYPLYAFARRKGASREDAEDVTQHFFGDRVVTKLVLQGIDPARGKFRTWLLNSFQNFLLNEWAKQRAQKRGGGVTHVSVDVQDAEGRYTAEPACDAPPEQFYDRVWACTLLTKALAQLRQSYEEKSETALYRELQNFLPGTHLVPAYEAVSARLGISEAALKMRVSRLKQDLRGLLKAEVKKTVSDPVEAEQELRYLRTVLGSQ